MRRERLSEETIDGLLLEARLRANPGVTARREAYYAKLRAFREATAHKTKAEMIRELKADTPAYILEILERQSEEEIRVRYVGTFGNR